MWIAKFSSQPHSNTKIPLETRYHLLLTNKAYTVGRDDASFFLFKGKKLSRQQFILKAVNDGSEFKIIVEVKGSTKSSINGSELEAKQFYKFAASVSKHLVFEFPSIPQLKFEIFWQTLSIDCFSNENNQLLDNLKESGLDFSINSMKVDYFNVDSDSATLDRLLKASKQNPKLKVVNLEYFQELKDNVEKLELDFRKYFYRYPKLELYALDFATFQKLQEGLESNKDITVHDYSSTKDISNSYSIIGVSLNADTQLENKDFKGILINGNSPIAGIFSTQSFIRKQSTITKRKVATANDTKAAKDYESSYTQLQFLPDTDDFEIIRPKRKRQPQLPASQEITKPIINQEEGISNLQGSPISSFHLNEASTGRSITPPVIPASQLYDDVDDFEVIPSFRNYKKGKDSPSSKFLQDEDFEVIPKKHKKQNSPDKAVATDGMDIDHSDSDPEKEKNGNKEVRVEESIHPSKQNKSRYLGIDADIFRNVRQSKECVTSSIGVKKAIDNETNVSSNMLELLQKARKLKFEADDEQEIPYDLESAQALIKIKKFKFKIYDDTPATPFNASNSYTNPEWANRKNYSRFKKVIGASNDIFDATTKYVGMRKSSYKSNDIREGIQVTALEKELAELNDSIPELDNELEGSNISSSRKRTRDMPTSRYHTQKQRSSTPLFVPEDDNDDSFTSGLPAYPDNDDEDGQPVFRTRARSQTGTEARKASPRNENIPSYVYNPLLNKRSDVVNGEEEEEDDIPMFRSKTSKRHR